MGQIFHLSDEFAPESGVTGMITQLTRYLADRGWPATILIPAGFPVAGPPAANLVELPLVPGGVWRFPLGLRSYLRRIDRLDGPILHLHGVWMGFQWLAARVGRQEKIPALLSPHGMLNRWHLRHIGFKELRKLIYWRAVAYPAFRHISLVHAVTPRERDELATWLPGQRIEVIPNAIDLEAMDRLRADAEAEPPPPGDEPYVLFLGRLHPVKGIELLIGAFAQAQRGAKRRFRLLIAGPESDPAYAAKLRSLARLLGVEDKVAFLGPVYEPRRKFSLYRHAWAFCAPSQTEVIGLVNLEAASVQVPVVTTHETGLWDWEEGGGVLVHPRVEELSRALEQVFSWSESERRDRGRSTRQLVERRYAWQAVGPLWLALYGSLT